MSELLYEIVRRTHDSDRAGEGKYVRLSRGGGRLIRSAPGEDDVAIPTGTSPLDAIRRDERLSLVREEQETTISVTRELAPLLALALNVDVAGDQVTDRDVWDVTINGVEHAPLIRSTMSR